HALEDAGARLVKASVLRDLKGGKLPADLRLDGPVVLNLERNESVVWVFNRVACYSVARSDKPATHSQQVGRSSLTMRMNGFKAVTTAPENDSRAPPANALMQQSAKKKPKSGQVAASDADTQPLALDGTGDLVLTNRHLCFLSDNTALKIPLRAIVAVVPHADGLRVMRDEASGKPQTFVLDDPSFAATAITLLNRL